MRMPRRCGSDGFGLGVWAYACRFTCGIGASPPSSEIEEVEDQLNGCGPRPGPRVDAVPRLANSLTTVVLDTWVLVSVSNHAKRSFRLNSIYGHQANLDNYLDQMVKLLRLYAAR